MLITVKLFLEHEIKQPLAEQSVCFGFCFQLRDTKNKAHHGYCEVHLFVPYGFAEEIWCTWDYCLGDRFCFLILLALLLLHLLPRLIIIMYGERLQNKWSQNPSHPSCNFRKRYKLHAAFVVSSGCFAKNVLWGFRLFFITHKRRSPRPKHSGGGSRTHNHHISQQFLS